MWMEVGKVHFWISFIYNIFAQWATEKNGIFENGQNGQMGCSTYASISQELLGAQKWFNAPWNQHCQANPKKYFVWS